MTMITPSYLGETIEYSSLHACRSTLEDPTQGVSAAQGFFHVSVQGSWIHHKLMAESGIGARYQQSWWNGRNKASPARHRLGLLRQRIPRFQ